MGIEIDGKGPTGNYVFSLGDGVLYKGSVDPDKMPEIEAAMRGWQNTNDPEERKGFEQTLLQGVSPDLVQKYNQINSITTEKTAGKNDSDNEAPDDDEEEDEESNRRFNPR